MPDQSRGIRGWSHAWLRLRQRQGAVGIPLPVLALSVVLLTSCVSAPPVSLHAPIPQQWRHATVLPEDVGAADYAWWKAFDDARLDALVEQASRDNLGIAEAAERVLAARVLARHSRDPFLPNLHARTSDAVDPDASASFFIAGFDSLWEFGLFGQRSSAQRVVNAQLDTATAGLHGARVTLVAEVVRNWIELRFAQAQETTLAGARDAHAERLRLMRIRQSMALASDHDVYDVEAELASADADLSEPRRLVDASLQRLAVLAGRSEPDPAWQVVGDQPVLKRVAVRSVPADLLRTRPEIATAEANVLRAAGELGISRAEMYPFIGLRAGIQWSTKISSDRRTPSRAVVVIGPVIDIPLFDWGMRIANAHARGHDLEAATLAYRQSVLDGVAEVEIALGDLEQLRARVDALALASQSAARALAISGRRVQMGLDSPIDLSAQRVASEQRTILLLEARARHGLAFVALNKALGGAGPTPDGGSR